MSPNIPAASVGLWSSTSQIPASVNIPNIIASAKPGSVAIILFGSQVLGDADEFSDVDILQIVDRAAPNYSVGKYNYHPRSLWEFSWQAREGNLFIKHIVDAGQIIYDPTNVIPKHLSDYRPPRDYVPDATNIYALADKMNRMSQIQYWINTSQKISNAAHVLAQAAYIRSAHEGKFVWGIKRQAALYNDPDLTLGRQLKNKQIEGYHNFKRVVQKAMAILAPLPRDSRLIRRWEDSGY